MNEEQTNVESESEVNPVTEDQSGATEDTGATEAETGNGSVDPADGTDLGISQEQAEVLIEKLQGIEDQTKLANDLTIESNKASAESFASLQETSGLSMTFEQGQAILENLDLLMQIGTNVMYLVIGFFVWWVIKQVYKIIGGIFFGGL